MTKNEFLDLIISQDNVSVSSILHYADFDVVKIGYDYSHINEYYYISNDEVTKVEIIAQLRYDFGYQPKEDDLYDLFECLCCGEQIEDDGMRFLWFDPFE